AVVEHELAGARDAREGAGARRVVAPAQSRAELERQGRVGPHAEIDDGLADAVVVALLGLAGAGGEETEAIIEGAEGGAQAQPIRRRPAHDEAAAGAAEVAAVAASAGVVPRVAVETHQEIDGEVFADHHAAG